MTKDEVLKLALEALENSVDLVREDAYNAEQLYGKYPSRQARVQGLKVLADDHEKAITAIKEALAAPVQEPVAHNEDWLEKMYWEFDAARAKSGEERLRFKGFMRAYGTKCASTTPPAAQPAPEQYTALEQALTRLQKRYGELEAKVAAQPTTKESLTVQPALKPLTDEQIEQIYLRYGGEMINCTRAIERAHGIKGAA